MTSTQPTVLVVEDDRMSQELLVAILRERYEVVLAANGAEMWQRLSEEGTIGAVVMDLALSGLPDGIELTRSLRTSDRWGDIPIVVLTSHADEEQRRAAIEAGCDRFVAKPYAPAHVMSIVGALIDAPRRGR
jgi:CheY-like chemotaxis protein